MIEPKELSTEELAQEFRAVIWANGGASRIKGHIAALEAIARERDRETCLNCQATRFEHSFEQWLYCRSMVRMKIAALEQNGRRRC